MEVIVVFNIFMLQNLDHDIVALHYFPDHLLRLF